MKKQLLFVALLCLPLILLSQNKTQILTGKVTDIDTKSPLIGASIIIETVSPPLGTQTDENGNFRLEVPLGRHIVKCQYLGYESFTSDALIFSSTREVILDVELLESALTTTEVVISANKSVSAPMNELSVVSTRSFSVEETERIPAGVNDPGRMALSFPGVQQGKDDSENDIIIRGNSSFGMLWRLEGIDIPNPNHFARAGTSGGGVTVFSAQLLSRSDFSTGGMPAEYGNAISGAFDVHFRKGSKESRQYSARIGVLGLDIAAEGPFQKNKSSYLVNYRYSTLGLLSRFGFYVVGERVVNDFQDLSFNLSFDSDDGKSMWTVFGMGGLSLEHYQPITTPTERDYAVSNHWEDRYRISNLGVLGTTFTRIIDDKSYFKAVVSTLASDITRDYDTLDLNDVPYRYNTEQYTDYRISTALSYNRKISPSTRFKTGIIAHQIWYKFFKETGPRRAVTNINENLNVISVNGEGATQTLQYYAQLNHRLNDRLTANIGGHFLFLNLNNTAALEPRVSFKYQLNEQQNLSFAYGLHSQILPLAAYFFNYQDTTVVNGQQVINTVTPNFDLKMVRSHHLIGGWSYVTPSRFRFTAEVYMQRLFNVPVKPEADDIYWMLNEQERFPEFPVTNDGKGLNYGIDIAIEKAFSSGFYFLLTASRFESNLELWDGRIFETKFSTGFASSYTIGKEFTFKNDAVLQIGGRVLYNGGFRYTPHDEVASLAAGTYVQDLSQVWGAQVRPYFRIDSRIAYRINKPNLAMNFTFDIQNVTDNRNPRGISYEPSTNTLREQIHPGGFIPVLSFRFDF